MPYTVYKVTNLVTQDFYIGVHKTDDPNDAYLGSGKIIREQVDHYGPEHFRKDILASFDKRRDAYKLEAELVEPLLGAPGCLNIHPGGHGGFGFINRPGGAGDLGRSRARAAGSWRIATDHRSALIASDPAYRALALKSMDRAREIMVGRGVHLVNLKRATAAWTGQTHTPESRARMSAAKQGEQNGAFGTKWLTHPGTGESRRVPTEEAVELQAVGWLPGRKMRA